MLSKLYDLTCLCAQYFVDPRRIRFSFPERKLWIHAASVGELFAVLPILKRFDSFWITVTSKNGLHLLSRFAMDGGLMPLDLKNFVISALEQVNPKFVLFAESEYWPNFCQQIAEKKIPFGIVNYSLNTHSFLSRFFLSKKVWFLKKSVFVYTQNDNTRDTLISFGVKQAKVGGNIKILNEPSIDINFENQLRNLRLSFPKIISLASLRKKDCLSLFPVLAQLLQQFHDICLIIFPRYLEHVPFFVREAKKYFGLAETYPRLGRVTIITKFGLVPTGVSQSLFYIIGGTFDMETGGHSPFEGAWFGIPGIAGPGDWKISHQRDLYIRIDSNESSLEVLRKIILNPRVLKDFSLRLKEEVEKTKTVADECVEIIKSYLV